MKLMFHYKDLERNSKQQAVMEAVVTGAKEHGDTVIPTPGWYDIPEHVDGCVILGFGKVNKWVYDAYINAHNVVYWDTGYIGTGHWRVSVNSHQPLNYLMAVNRPSDRWDRLGVKIKPYKQGTHILFDGASNKFIRWHNLGGDDFRLSWHCWGEDIVKTIRQHTKKPIIYRPRPTARAKLQPALPISGSELSQGPLGEDFDRAFVVVSYGGTLGVDAVVHGVPHFAIGSSPARPVSETEWCNLNNPRIPSEEERLQYLWNLAYHQWTLEEIASGEAWGHIRQRFRFLR